MARPRKLESDYPAHITRDGNRYVFDKKRVADTQRDANRLRRQLQREAKDQFRRGIIDGYRVPKPKKRLIRTDGKRGGFKHGYIVLKYVR